MSEVHVYPSRGAIFRGGVIICLDLLRTNLKIGRAEAGNQRSRCRGGGLWQSCLVLKALGF